MKFGNRVVTWLLRLGAPLGRMALLTVDGRVSGKARSVPVAVAPDTDGWIVTSVHGQVDWVKNLRAAGKATLTRRGEKIRVNVDEMPPREAARPLREIMRGAGRTTQRIIGPYFPTDIEAPLSEWEAEAGRHPMFLLQPSGQPPRPRSTFLPVLVWLLIAGITLQVFLAGVAAFGEPWDAHRRFGVIVEAISLATAVVAVITRRVGARWLTVAVFVLITLQHGTSSIGSGLAAGLHPVNAMIMFALTLVVHRRLRRSQQV